MVFFRGFAHEGVRLQVPIWLWAALVCKGFVLLAGGAGAAGSATKHKHLVRSSISGAGSRIARFRRSGLQGALAVFAMGRVLQTRPCFTSGRGGHGGQAACLISDQKSENSNLSGFILMADGMHTADPATFNSLHTLSTKIIFLC